MAHSNITIYTTRNNYTTSNNLFYMQIGADGSFGVSEGVDDWWNVYGVIKLKTWTHIGIILVDNGFFIYILTLCLLLTCKL